MNRIHVACSDTQQISVFGVPDDPARAPGDALRPLATIDVQAPPQTGRSMVMATNPGATRLYAAYLRDGRYTVATYAIDADDGVPRLLGAQALADTMAYMATDRTGRFLLCASYAGNRVTVNEVLGDGRVGPLLQDVATEPKAHCILADASNRHVLHTSLGGDVIYQQRFDALTGRLSPNEPPLCRTAPGSGPRFLAFGRDGRHVYVNGELDGTVSVYGYDAGAGTLGACMQTVSLLPPGFTGAAWAADLVVSADGRWLYTSERTSSTVAAFAIDAVDGSLRQVGWLPSVRQPRALAIDPAGRFLVAAGQLSHSVALYAIDAESGALRHLAEHPVGRNPTWISVVSRPPSARSSAG